MAFVLFCFNCKWPKFPKCSIFKNLNSFVTGSDSGPVWELAASASRTARDAPGCGLLRLPHSTSCWLCGAGTFPQWVLGAVPGPDSTLHFPCWVKGELYIAQETFGAANKQFLRPGYGIYTCSYPGIRDSWRWGDQEGVRLHP